MSTSLAGAPDAPPPPGAPPATLGQALLADVRRLAAAACAGLVTGFFVLGWGARLAMMLLARLNPRATGRLSDDGFLIGQFNLGETMGLVFFLTFVGMVGGLLFLLLRQLRFGPPWFRTWSMIVGPAIAGGALLVNPDGVDFRILEPTWLAIALFVALPGAYAAAVAALADRWLRGDSWFRTGPAWHAAPALVVVALGPILIAPAIALLVHARWVTSPGFQRRASAEGLRMAARVIMGIVFVGALALLVDKTLKLV